jgi:hypothetical protein
MLVLLYVEKCLLASYVWSYILVVTYDCSMASMYRAYLICLCRRRKNRDVWKCTSQVGVLELVTLFRTHHES